MISLLVVIYVVFISLGLPDSLFGVAWPVVHTEFSIDENFDGAKMLTTEQMFQGQDNLISVNTQFSKSKSCFSPLFIKSLTP